MRKDGSPELRDSSERQNVQPVASESLETFAHVAKMAQAGLTAGQAIDPSSYTQNTFTADELTRALRSDAHERLTELETLSREPAVARIVVKGSAGKEVYFIARAGGAASALPGGARLVNYRTPVGRLASLPVGSEFEIQTQGRARAVEIIEHA